MKPYKTIITNLIWPNLSINYGRNWFVKSTPGMPAAPHTPSPSLPPPTSFGVNGFPAHPFAGDECRESLGSSPRSGSVTDEDGAVHSPNSGFKWKSPIPSSGANPTIASYNASAAKVYNATSSLVHFENNILFNYEKRSSLLQRWRCSCKYNSRRYIGLAPGIKFTSTISNLSSTSELHLPRWWYWAGVFSGWFVLKCTGLLVVL
jgi:hypothetical protein